MTTGTESGRQRDKRHRQRALFDGIAEQYDEYRPGYPARVLEFVTSTAGLGPGAAVLEVGCGTGHLTEPLAGRGFRLTAIDIGPSMIAAARRRLPGADVSFQVTSFEDLDAADASFDLVISSAAFHWVDPGSRSASPRGCCGQAAGSPCSTPASTTTIPPARRCTPHG